MSDLFIRRRIQARQLDAVARSTVVWDYNLLERERMFEVVESVVSFHARAGTMYSFFFFQAEDGIRDIGVTGVQTCALPICRPERPDARRRRAEAAHGAGRDAARADAGGEQAVGADAGGESARERRLAPDRPDRKSVV